MIGRGSIAWLIVSLVGAGLAGYEAYEDAKKFAVVVDLLATVISILVGVSLAVIAVLNSPFTVSEDVVSGKDEAGRMTRLVKQDDSTIASGQLIFFWIYFAALALALCFKWVSAGSSTDFTLFHLKLLACLTASIGCFAFLWSARLPLLLQSISKQRRSLG